MLSDNFTDKVMDSIAKEQMRRKKVSHIMLYIALVCFASLFLIVAIWALFKWVYPYNGLPGMFTQFIDISINWVEMLWDNIILLFTLPSDSSAKNFSMLFIILCVNSVLLLSLYNYFISRKVVK